MAAAEPLGKYKMHPPKDGLHENFNVRFDPNAKSVGEEFAARIHEVGTDAYNAIYAGVTDPREAILLASLLMRAIGMNTTGPLLVDAYRGIEVEVEGEGLDRSATSIPFDTFYHSEETQRLLSDLEALLSPEAHPGVPVAIKEAAVLKLTAGVMLRHLFRALAEDAGNEPASDGELAATRLA